MSEKDGGPAFPIPELVAPNTGDLIPACQQGLSVRDYFAAHAPISFQDAIAVCGWERDRLHLNDVERGTVLAVLALMRIEYADAILAERERK